MRKNPEQSTDSISGRWNRLNAGIDVLEEWSRTAPQAERNSVYAALFAVGDGSLFRLFQTMTHRSRPDEVTIYLREDLVVAISRTETDFFDIAYIGSPESAPGVEQDSN